MGECPANTCDAKAAGYLGILINVARIVIIDEVVAESLTKNNPGKSRQKDADADAYPTAVRFGGSYRLDTEGVHLRRCDCGGDEGSFYSRSRNRPVLKAAMRTDKG